MKPDPRSPIGIIDSGMGGISIWTEIVRAMPGEDTIYWADSAHCPYGGRTRKEITALVEKGVETLVAAHVKIIVIACNTATAAAIATLRQTWPDMLFVGLEPAVKPAAQTTRSGVIGVLGTTYTIHSDMFRQTIERHASAIQVISVSGNGLVEQVEQGLENTPETHLLLQQYIAPMLTAGADRLVLACTHYPLLTPQIRQIIGTRRMEIINPAPAIARHTLEMLQTHKLLATPTASEGHHHFISTGGETQAEKLRTRAEAYRNADN